MSHSSSQEILSSPVWTKSFICLTPVFRINSGLEHRDIETHFCTRLLPSYLLMIRFDLVNTESYLSVFS